MDVVRCSECGEVRTAGHGQDGEPRTPCTCGADAIDIEKVLIADTITFTDSVTAELTPADQDRDPRRRFIELDRELGEMSAPNPGDMSGEAMHQVQDRLQRFYVGGYNLKDSLKVHAAQYGITGNDVEQAVNDEPALGLLADLANLEKHTKLTRNRTGHTPTIGAASTVTVAGGWQLKLPIDHAGKTLDGLQVAADAVDAWRRKLTAWGVL